MDPTARQTTARTITPQQAMAGQTPAWQIGVRRSAPPAAAAPAAAALAPGARGIASTDLPAMVSLRAEVPEPLLHSMRGFIEAHPNWDQYRLFQAALAGFLVQNGVQSREITRCYLANLFPQQPRFAEPL